MIKIKEISRVRNGAFLGAMNSVMNFVEQENIDDLGIKAPKAAFAKEVDNLTKHFKSYERTSEHTEVIAQLDIKRDDAYRGLVKHIALFTKFPEEDKVKAAKDLNLIIKKYGKTIYLKPLEEETGIITAFLQELSATEITQKIALIGATPWVNALQNNNKKLADISQERTSKSAATEAGITKSIRNKTYEAFKNLVQTINSLAFLHGEEKYKRLIDRINEVMKNVAEDSKTKKTAQKE